ncbi:MAG: S8 family serine peptidase [Bdellovibrionota bacterium]|nr:S8 family serine peptidase [Bdellovibrionota bacterium]
MKNLILPLSLLAGLWQGTQAQDFNDTLFEKQWGLSNSGQTISRRSGDLTYDQIVGIKGRDINYVDFKSLHPDIPADREIVVAVLDSGLDVNHPEIKDRIFFDKKLCPKEEDAKTKPCSGINILKRNLDLTDDMGHGTHVAGIIAATAQNKQGIAGITDERIKILPVKVLSDEISGFVYNQRYVTDLFADGIAYAIQRGAHVINMSIGWPKLVQTPRMQRALALAAQRNVVVIAAAGNNNKEVPTYPCTVDKVICVGAVDNTGAVTEFSNYGGKVDILAPGEFIVSTYPQDSVESRILRIRGYETKNGTSQASPYIAGIAASLKLIDPRMPIREIMARLFSSSRDREESIFEGKFSKYGLVDMKKALISAPKHFASPDFKELLDLNYKSRDGSFFFSLPIESLMGDFKDLQVSVSFNRSDIVIEAPEQSIDLKEGQKRSVLIKGKLLDLNKDSNFLMTVALKSSDFSSVTQTTLIFSRDLGREGADEVSAIEGFKDTELTFIEGARKVSRVKKVRFSSEETNAPIYHAQVPSLQTEEKTTLSLLLRKQGKWGRLNLELEKFHEVSNVSSSDFNDDGKLDFLVFGISEDQKSLVFNYLLGQDSGDYKTEKFLFPLLNYKNFPLEYDELGETAFISIPFKGESLLVPTFKMTYRLPEEDNTDDILERVPETAIAQHQYFLEPLENGEMRLRVVNSLEAINTFRMQFFIEEWQSVSFDEAFPQGPKDRALGLIRGLVSVGEEFARDYYLYTFVNGQLSFERVFFPERLLAGNNTRELLSVDGESFGEVTKNVEFLAALKRDQVRSYVWNPQTKRGEALVIDTKNWSDPIFNSISAFNDENKTRLIETRYYLRSYGKNGEQGRLRINRESSFPGVQFSETLSPILLKKEGDTLPGLFINSTLIFGNRLYTMAQTEEGFIRPLRFSVDIPNLCVYLNPEKIDGTFHYMMLCRKGQGEVALETVPLVY